MTEQIQEGLEQLEVPYTVESVAQLKLFTEHLLEKNKHMNLTAITKVEDIIGLHLLDSAILTRYLPEKGGTLIDIGTGAGFPGMVLQILRPHLQVSLLDALQKRLVWLEEMAELLELEHLKTVHGRGEELCHTHPYRETYDVATSRAVADLSVLAEISLPYVKVGGLFLAMKSKNTENEIYQAMETIELLGGHIKELLDYKIPWTDIKHRVVVIEKISPTDEKFPRRWSKIKKKSG